MESLVSDILAGDGKIVNLFLQCMYDSFGFQLALYMYTPNPNPDTLLERG
jgi:hypothetical protein